MDGRRPQPNEAGGFAELGGGHADRARFAMRMRFAISAEAC
jgi:hypothetical protein